jgi:hypothetical protein
LDLLLINSLRLWSLGKKLKGGGVGWDYEAISFLFFGSAGLLVASDLCYFASFLLPMVHRHTLLRPGAAGASVHGGFLPLHFQY